MNFLLKDSLGDYPHLILGHTELFWSQRSGKLSCISYLHLKTALTLTCSWFKKTFSDVKHLWKVFTHLSDSSTKWYQMSPSETFVVVTYQHYVYTNAF